MVQPPKVEKYNEFGVTSQFVIEVQPLFIRNSFQQLFACVPSYQPKSLLFKPKWGWNKIPDVIRARIVQLALDEPDLSHYGLKSASSHVRKGISGQIPSRSSCLKGAKSRISPRRNRWSK
jgi:hypothetical protein